MRRFTLRAFLGALAGTVIAAGAFLLLPDAGAEGAFATTLAPRGWEWGYLLVIPVVAGVTALAATRIAAMHVLTTLEEG